MRIAYFCQYFVPETNAPAARISELARMWADSGHDVTVVTGLPNHPTGRVPEAYRNVLFRHERFGNVKVWRNWLYATPNEGFVKKTLSHLSFMASTLLLSVPRLRSTDVLVVSSPTFFVAITVCIAHWLWRIPYVFEVRDLWPGVFVELGIIKNRAMIRSLEAIEMFLYRRAALVVVVTESFKEILVARGLSAKHVAVITNGVDTDVFRPHNDASLTIKACHGISARRVVLYIGAHGISHALGSILEVAEQFRHEPELAFVFVGDGAEKQQLMKAATARRLANVQFFPSQPRESVPLWYAAADIVLVPLRRIPIFDSFIPSKIFEILGCERPIVASVRGEARRILERSGGAIVVEPEDGAAIASAIRRLLADNDQRETLAKRGGTFVRAEYDRRVLGGRYLQLLESVTR